MSAPVVRMICDEAGVCGISVNGQEIEVISVDVRHRPDRVAKVTLELETTDFSYIDRKPEKQAGAG